MHNEGNDKPAATEAVDNEEAVETAAVTVDVINKEEVGDFTSDNSQLNHN